MMRLLAIAVAAGAFTVLQDPEVAKIIQNLSGMKQGLEQVMGNDHQEAIKKMIAPWVKELAAAITKAEKADNVKEAKEELKTVSEHARQWSSALTAKKDELEKKQKEMEATEASISAHDNEAELSLKADVDATKQAPKEDAESKKSPEQLTKDLEHMMAGLEMVAKTSGGLKPMMEPWIAEIDAALKESKKMSGDAKKQKLVAMIKTAHSWTSVLAQKTEDLMHEEQNQKVNLLIGVLSTRAKESFDDQLEVLKADDFKNLDVAKALIAKHDSSKSLVSQVAEWMDAHEKNHATKAGGLQGAMEGISVRIDLLKKKIEGMSESEKKRLLKLDGILAEDHFHKDKKLQMQLKSFSNGQHRKYMKAVARNKMELGHLEKALEAIKKHDPKALKKEQDALQKQFEQEERDAQVRAGNFLH